MMRFRAAVMERSGVQRPYDQTRPLVIREVELSDPKPDEVLVRIAAAGLCHSDLSVINGDRPRQTPMVLGHEAAGIVESVGRAVYDLQPGDHIVCFFAPNCGHCAPCSEGRPALCEPGAVANGKGELLAGACACPVRLLMSIIIVAFQPMPNTLFCRVIRWSRLTRTFRCRSLHCWLRSPDRRWFDLQQWRGPAGLHGGDCGARRCRIVGCDGSGCGRGK